MATNFPTSLDSLSNPTPSNKLGDAGVLHSDQHANANDAIEALQAKVGITNSAVTSTLDYKVRNVPIGSAVTGLGTGVATFLATPTSANLAAILNDETGAASGSPLVVFSVSPALSGTPTAPTANVDSNSTQIATTAYVINQGYLKSATATSTYAPLAGATFTGSITTVAGNATTAPIVFQSGSVLTNPAGGRMEYDGRIHYLTPSSTAVGGRTVAAGSHYFALSGDRTLTNANTAQSVFGVGLTLQATTTYEIEMAFSVSTTGATSNSLGIGFGGTATLTSIGYTVETTQNATSLATLSGGSKAFFATATNQTVTAAVATATYRTILVKGIVRANASGTFIPQLTYSAAPGVAPTVSANSYIRMTPIGSNTVTGIGAWA